MSEHRPFTYLVGWKLHAKFYYGVRYAKGCNPSDLWKTYFTSSKLVAQYRMKYGEPDVVEIRQTFSTRKAAIAWEHKVLRRLKVIRRDLWLNRSDNKNGFELGGTWDEIMGPERAAARRWRQRQRFKGLSRPNKGLPKHNDTFKEAQAERARQRWKDPVFKRQNVEKITKRHYDASRAEERSQIQKQNWDRMSDQTKQRRSELISESARRDAAIRGARSKAMWADSIKRAQILEKRAQARLNKRLSRRTDLGQ